MRPGRGAPGGRRRLEPDVPRGARPRLRILQGPGRADFLEETRRPYAMLCLPFAKQQCVSVGEAVTRIELLDRGPIAPQLRERLELGQSRRSGHEPAAAAAARARAGRQSVPFRRQTVRLQERSGLEDSGPVGQRSEARGGAGAVAARSELSGITRVLIRFGTSPTAMPAISFIASVSIADTLRSPALEI